MTERSEGESGRKAGLDRSRDRGAYAVEEEISKRISLPSLSCVKLRPNISRRPNLAPLASYPYHQISLGFSREGYRVYLSFTQLFQPLSVFINLNLYCIDNLHNLSIISCDDLSSFLYYYNLYNLLLAINSIFHYHKEYNRNMFTNQ